MSEEAGRDQQTMAICLDEVQRCQKASPKPNFIVLLGDRYGWCPLPASIEALEFEEITARLSDEERALLVFDEARPEEGNGWYRRDANAVPVAYRLRERKVVIDEGASDEQEQAAKDAEEASWRKLEPCLRDALRKAIDELGWAPDDERRIKYETSATEQEILRGALDRLPRRARRQGARLRASSARSRTAMTSWPPSRPSPPPEQPTRTFLRPRSSSTSPLIACPTRRLARGWTT